MPNEQLLKTRLFMHMRKLFLFLFGACLKLLLWWWVHTLWKVLSQQQHRTCIGSPQMTWSIASVWHLQLCLNDNQSCSSTQDLWATMLFQLTVNVSYTYMGQLLRICKKYQLPNVKLHLTHQMSSNGQKILDCSKGRFSGLNKCEVILLKSSCFKSNTWISG